jgi:hypothetical protein
MSNRAINLFEKLQLTKHSNFVGTLEIRALINAKYWYDFNGTADSVNLTALQLGHLKAYATEIHQKGFVPDNVNFARTWLSIYNGAVSIPETNGVEDWDLTTPAGLDAITKWFVTSDQISIGVDDSFKIHAFR